MSHCRAHLGRLENEFADLERLVAEQELPREVLQTVLHLSRHQKGDRPKRERIAGAAESVTRVTDSAGTQSSAWAQRGWTRKRRQHRRIEDECQVC
jgi:hypothetical protein